MIFIPKKLKIGFQNRRDTYTGKLAYVTYYDEKENLRKETSWESWRSKDIDPIGYDNVPMEGFVLNKKVGDYHYNWNGRQAWIRVYDPRGFEFEIGVDNLLHILENTSSIVGKGLEGEFIYAFDGGSLVLLSTKSNDYIQATRMSKAVFEKRKISKKELVKGHVYKDKNDESLVYLGDYDTCEYDSYGDELAGHVREIVKRPWFLKRDYAKSYKTLPYLVEEVGDRSAEYADLFERYVKNNTGYNPIVVKEEVLYTLEEFKENVKARFFPNYYSHIWYSYVSNKTFCARWMEEDDLLVQITKNYREKNYRGIFSNVEYLIMTWEEAWVKTQPYYFVFKNKEGVIIMEKHA